MLLLRKETIIKVLFFIVILMLFVLDLLTSFNTGAILPRVFFQVGFSVAIIYFLFVIIFNRRILSSSFILFVLFFTSFFIDFFILNNFSYEAILKNLYLFVWLLLVIFASYLQYHYSNFFNEKIFYILLYFSFFFVLFSMYHYKVSYNITLGASVYTSLVFYPWLQSQKNSRLKKISFLILCIIVFISFKRGAILCLIAAIYINWFISLNIAIKPVNLIKQGALLISSMIAILLSLYVIDNYFEGALTKRFTLEELESGSGRGESNAAAINYIKNIDSVPTLLFGSKDYEIPDFLGHNDWLIFFINSGLISVLALVSFFSMLLIRVISCYKKKDVLVYSYMSLLIIMFLMSLYSTSFGPAFHPIILFLTLGILEGSRRKTRTFSS